MREPKVTAQPYENATVNINLGIRLGKQAPLLTGDTDTYFTHRHAHTQ